MHRVWIELEKPTPEEGEEVGKQRADLLNKMLKKLGIEYAHFVWWPNERKYIYEYQDNAGFIYLNDNGEWFNLEYLAR